MLRSLRRRAEFQRKAGEIYGAIVTQSRQPAFYARLGIPDTPTGRYEMVVIHLFLVLERLRGAGASPEAEAAAQALVDAFVADMDDSLRELGAGDVGVPRRVKRAAAGFYARAKDYREAIAAGGPRWRECSPIIWKRRKAKPPRLARWQATSERRL